MRSAPLRSVQQLPSANREEVEVRQPERDGDHEARGRRPTISSPWSASSRDPSPTATSDSPIAMITINPCRSAKCARLNAPPSDARRRAGPNEADHERGDPEQHALSAPSKNPATTINAEPPSTHGTRARIALQELAVAARRKRVQRRLHHDLRSGMRRRTRPRPRRSSGYRERCDEHRRHRDEHGGPRPCRLGVDRVRQPRVRCPGPPERRHDQAATARGRSRSSCRPAGSSPA